MLQFIGLQRVEHNLATEQQEQYYPSGFPGGSVVKNPPANAGDVGSGRSPGGGNGNLFQCSCLENPMDWGAWWAIAHGVTKSWSWLSGWAQTDIISSVTRHILSHGSEHTLLTAKPDTLTGSLTSQTTRHHSLIHVDTFPKERLLAMESNSPSHPPINSTNPTLYPHCICDTLLHIFCLYLCVFVHAMQAGCDGLHHLENSHQSFKTHSGANFSAQIFFSLCQS